MAIASKWIVTTLSADASLVAALAKRPDDATKPGIYRGLRPTGAAFPHLIFTILDSRSVQEVSSTEIMTANVVSVRAVGTQGAGVLDLIAARVKAALHGQHVQPVVGGGLINSCAIRDALEYSEIDSGITYTSLGWRFDIMIKES
jgi:hypothetical protein